MRHCFISRDLLNAGIILRHRCTRMEANTRGGYEISAIKKALGFDVEQTLLVDLI